MSYTKQSIHIYMYIILFQDATILELILRNWIELTLFLFSQQLDFHKQLSLIQNFHYKLKPSRSNLTLKSNERITLCGAVINCLISAKYSQMTPHSSPIRTRYGLPFVGSDSLLIFCLHFCKDVCNIMFHWTTLYLHSTVYIFQNLTHWGRVTHICIAKPRPSLVQTKACCLASAKPLSEPMLEYC